MDQELYTAIFNACEALHNLEMVAAAPEVELSDRAREMLDELEAHLPVDEDPGAFSANAVECF